MPTTFQIEVDAPYTAPAPAKTFTLPSSADMQVGDLMVAIWCGGAAPDSNPAGWTQRKDAITDGGATGFDGRVITRLAQSGDFGATVTWPSTSVSKVDIVLVVLRSVDQVAPVPSLNHRLETVSGTTHAGPTIAGVAAAGKSLQIICLKEATVSSTRTVSTAGYTVVANHTNGSATNAQTVVVAMSNADVAAGTFPAVTFDFGANATDKAFMIAMAIGPVTTLVGVYGSSDVLVPAGATVVGAASALAAESDSDVNTYTLFGVSATAVHRRVRFGAASPPLSGPLQHVTRKLVLDGATSITITPSLYHGATLIATYAPHTFSGAGEQTFTWDIPTGDQTAQVGFLADIEWDEAWTGS